MLVMRLLPAVGLAFGLLLPGNVRAEPLSTTKYTYYSLSGTSVSDIYNSMLRNGPRVNGGDAYAATTATTSQAGNFVQGKNCQVQNYQVRISFVIRLPKLANGTSLSPTEMSRWQQFTEFARIHEETHRSIWLGCARDLEDQVRALKAQHCDDANAAAAKLWTNILAACSAKHIAFDAAEQKRLLRNPFIRTVLKAQSRDVKAAAVK